MRARDLFIGSFRLMIDHRRTALMLIAPLIIVNAVSLWSSERATSQLLGAPGEASVNAMLAINFSGLAISLISLCLGAIIAVAWHRKLLLEEGFAWSRAAIFRAPVWSYIRGVIKVALIVIGLAFILAFAAVLVGSLLVFLFELDPEYSAISLGAFLVFALVIVGIWVFTTRYSVALPSRAIDNKIGFREAFGATKGTNWMLVRLGLLGFLVFFLPSFLADFDGMAEIFEMQERPSAIEKSSVLRLLLSTIVTSIAGLFQVGVLTILYAHFVQKEGDGLICSG